MKKIFRVDRFVAKLLSGILVLLGFSGCSSSSEEDDGGGLLMYAPLARDFEIKGKVVDKESKKAIPEIQVVAYPLGERGDEYILSADTMLTDSDGGFRVKQLAGGIDYRIIYEDIDGEANGGIYKKDTLDIDFSDPDIEIIRENGRNIVSFIQEMEKEDEPEIPEGEE